MASHLELDKFSDGGRGRPLPLGIHNSTMPPVICYQLSILQVLFHYPLFAEKVIRHQQKAAVCIPGLGHEHEGCQADGGKQCDKCCDRPWCIICRLKLMLDHYWTRKEPADLSVIRAYTFSFRKLMFELGDPPKHSGCDWRDYIWDRNNNAQADAFEFWQWARNLAKFDTETPAGNVRALEADGLPPWDIVLGAWYTQKTSTPDPNTSCSHSDEPSIRKEHEAMIGEAKKWVQDKTSLVSLITEQVLIPETDWNCPEKGCTGRRVITKKWLNLPPLLPIYLGRHTFDRYKGARKCTTTFPIPGKLDASLWYSGPENPHYELYAVITHLGELNSGHYKTVLKTAYDQWVELNDDMVSGPFEAAEEDEAEEARLGYPPNLPYRWQGGGWTPYMIFYRRVQPKTPAKKSTKKPMKGRVGQLRAASSSDDDGLSDAQRDARLKALKAFMKKCKPREKTLKRKQDQREVDATDEPSEKRSKADTGSSGRGTGARGRGGRGRGRGRGRGGGKS